MILTTQRFAIAALLILLVSACRCYAQDAIQIKAPVEVTEAKVDAAAQKNYPTTKERLAWWQEAKFGMFIHWGAYSKAGGVWNGETHHHEWLQFTAKIPLAEYTEYAETFDPKDFSPNEWVTIAKNAGMKYLIITSKHHDGITMYDSTSSEHNIVDLAGLEEEPVRQLAEACRKQGIRFGVYYSLGRDWEDPDVPTGKYKNMAGWRSNLIDYPNEKDKIFHRYFERKVKPQVSELLSDFGTIDVLWFDTPEKISPEESKELLELARSLQPNCIVNQRVGNDLGDYGTPEQTIPHEASVEPWETCMTLNGHWAYNKADDNWKTTASLLHNLVDIVSKGGNYLLNVGPTGDGVIPSPSVERLSEMGDWLEANGEAIYGCGPTPFGEELGSYSLTKKDKKGRAVFTAMHEWRVTTKPGKLFLHLLKWPDRQAALPAMAKRVTKAYFLNDPNRTELIVQQSDSEVAIELPETAPDPYVSVICLELSK